MKIFDRKDVYSWSNAKTARQYIGKEGYFGDSIAELDRKIRGDFQNILMDIFDSDTDRASFPFGNNDEETWSLFIPTDKVRKEKKWRAFRTFDELKENGLILGLHLAYRRKDNREQRNIGIITGFQLVDNKLTISIGPNTFSLNQLFNEYELYDELEWKPFGIEEAEETEE